MATQPKTAKGWRLLEHTADIRLEVVGGTIEDLFVNAAKGFAELVSEPRDVAPYVELDLRLQAEVIDDLLVDWLRELLFLHETRGFVFVQPEFFELAGTTLRTRFLGRELEDDEVPRFDVKAVTYHDVSVDRTDQGYVSRIVFDI
jgi:SHS2 domain-containing protein